VSINVTRFALHDIHEIGERKRGEGEAPPLTNDEREEERVPSLSFSPSLSSSLFFCGRGENFSRTSALRFLSLQLAVKLLHGERGEEVLTSLRARNLCAEKEKKENYPGPLARLRLRASACADLGVGEKTDALKMFSPRHETEKEGKRDITVVRL